DSGSRPQLPAGILPGDHLDGERPFDGELRVVVPGAGGGVPVVRRGGEVDDLAVVGECLVAVGTSLGDVVHGVLVGVEGDADPVQVAGRGGPQVQRHVEY